MVSKNILKEIVLSNEEFITKYTGSIIKREGVFIPDHLNKTIVFFGVRRSGKTFILFDLFKRHSNYSIYIDFEDERLIGFGVDDFDRLREAILELKPHLADQRTVLLLDEVQNVEGWERFCRRVSERENVRVFISGSSSRITPAEIHTELRGRAWSLAILPFSFREYLHAKGIDPDDRTIFYEKRKILVKKHFSQYLRWGGFPEVSLVESDFEKTKLLKEYLNAMFFRDLVERYEITNIHLIESLIDKIFSSFSTKFSSTAFYKHYKDKFPFSKDLLFRYYKHFIQSMLVFEIRKFAESSYKRMRNPAKIYLVDTGISRRVTFSDHGRLLENVVLLELIRRGFEVSYFEEKRECDFIAKRNDKLFPIQVSYEINEDNNEREIDGLVEACRHLGLKDGLILTSDDEQESTREGITINMVPAWKWLLENRA